MPIELRGATTSPICTLVATMAGLLIAMPLQAQTLGGASGPAGDATKVERCDAPKGTLAVVEPQDAVLQALLRIGLQSPVGMIRLIVQQSNCFQIVERGAAFQNLMQERALASGGQLQTGQNVGQGQMVAADFVVTPSVVLAKSTFFIFITIPCRSRSPWVTGQSSLVRVSTRGRRSTRAPGNNRVATGPEE